jgi:protein-L-isoaspartate(D-aspartate) O-methyltransferase
MTAKSRKFPLHFSSLENNSLKTSTNRSSKLHSAVLHIETPQTATRNVRQHGVRVLEKREEKADEKHIEKNVHKHKPEHQKKLNSVSIGSEGPRRAMVARLVQQGIKDEVVLAAMGSVPRHQFIEPALIGQAYVDASLPIGNQQTISQPYIVARMTEVMRHGRKLNSVLEIGTGCGYQAAVLAQVCEHVYSIERIKSLHELAKKNLRSLRIANLRLHYGDGMLGLPQVAPFDGIILAAAGLQIPDALLQQLAIGGRLIAPVGEKQQVLQLIERTGNAEWTRSELEECYFVPLCPGTI